MLQPRCFLIAAAALQLFALSGFVAAQTVPGTINFQGRLTDNSPQQNPVSATVPMQFAIYGVAAGGAPLWQEPAGTATLPVSVTGGIFNVLLGNNGVALPAAIFNGGTQRWLEITAGGEILSPRQAIGASGYANQAQNAASAASAVTAASANNALQLGGVPASGYQAATAQNCAAGQFLNVIANGSASCASPPANNLNPPVSLSGVANPVLTATNTGMGGAARFSNSLAANGSDALTAFTAGTGSALRASASGSGAAAYLYSNGNGSAAAVINDNNAATGPALFVGNTSSAPAIHAENNNGVGDLFQGWNGDIQPVFRLDGFGRVTAAKFTGDGSGLTNLPGGNLAPPLTLSAASSSVVISSTNSGSGGAGFFMVNNGASPAIALQAASSGTGDAISASTGGSGNGVSSFVSGGGSAIYGVTSGLGQAGQFSVSNPANSSNAVSAISNGSGRSLFVNNVGTGQGAYVTINNNANSSSAVQGFTLGTGRAGLFTISNAASAATALGAASNGTGPSLVSQNTSTGDLLHGDNGSGTVLRVDNAGNVSATKFSGDGSGLSNLPGGGINPPVTLSAATPASLLSANNSGAGYGVSGIAVSASSFGVFGQNNSGLAGTAGVYGQANGAAGYGVWGFNTSGAAVYGNSISGAAVSGYSGIGDLYSGANGSGVKFRVDNGGNLTAGTGGFTGDVAATGRFAVGVYTKDCGTPAASPFSCTCNNGDPAIGGGAYAHYGQLLRESRPSGSSWVVSCAISGNVTDVACWGAYAVCLSHGG